MLADTLKRAVATLREHAERTDQAPADLDWNVDSTGLYMDGSAYYSLRPRRNHPTVWRGDARSGTPEYIALMHPPVALALADWLDETAEIVAGYTPEWDAWAEALFPESFAGWVEQGPDGAFWRLTDAGRDVLREATP